MTNLEDCLRTPYIIAMSDILSVSSSSTASATGSHDDAETHVKAPKRYRLHRKEHPTLVEETSSAASSVLISPRSTPPASIAGDRSGSPNSTISLDSSIGGGAFDGETKDPRKRTVTSTTAGSSDDEVAPPPTRTVTFDSSADRSELPRKSIYRQLARRSQDESGRQATGSLYQSWVGSLPTSSQSRNIELQRSGLQAAYLDYVAGFIEASRNQTAMYQQTRAALHHTNNRLLQKTHEVAATQAENGQLIMEVEQLRSLMRTQEPNDLDTTVDRPSEEAPTPSTSSSNKLSQSVVKQDDLPLASKGRATPRARLGNWSRRLQRINKEKAHQLPGYARVLQYPVRLAHDCRKASSRDWKSAKEAATERRRRGTSRLARKLVGKVLPFADFS